MTPDPGSYWEIVSGSDYCQIVDDGRCVTDGYDNYGNSESCEVRALRGMTLVTMEWAVESCCDYITVDGIQYKSSGPQGVYVGSGYELTWTSDGSVTRAGFKVCSNQTETAPVTISSSTTDGILNLSFSFGRLNQAPHSE